jgi:hypothetical protein
MFKKANGAITSSPNPAPALTHSKTATFQEFIG